MLTKLAGIMVLLFATMGSVWAQVDINRADQVALESIKGVGPAMSKSILDERTKGGSFKDWSDLEKRVKGIGPASSKKLSQAGLTVNGQPRPDANPSVVAQKGKDNPKNSATK